MFYWRSANLIGSLVIFYSPIDNMVLLELKIIFHFTENTQNYKFFPLCTVPVILKFFLLKQLAYFPLFFYEQYSPLCYALLWNSITGTSYQYLYCVTSINRWQQYQLLSRFYKTGISNKQMSYWKNWKLIGIPDKNKRKSWGRQRTTGHKKLCH